MIRLLILIPGLFQCNHLPVNYFHSNYSKQHLRNIFDHKTLKIITHFPNTKDSQTLMPACIKEKQKVVS